MDRRGLPELLLQLSEAMADEVEALAALPSIEIGGQAQPAGPSGVDEKVTLYAGR
jgi:hypothetical protein